MLDPRLQEVSLSGWGEVPAVWRPSTLDRVSLSGAALPASHVDAQKDKEYHNSLGSYHL